MLLINNNRILFYSSNFNIQTIPKFSVHTPFFSTVRLLGRFQQIPEDIILKHKN